MAKLVACYGCDQKGEKSLFIQETNKKYYHIDKCHGYYLEDKEKKRIENEHWSALFEYLKVLHDVFTIPPRNCKRLRELRIGNDIKAGGTYQRYSREMPYDLMLESYIVAEDTIKWFIIDVLKNEKGAEEINKCITLMLNNGLNKAWQNRQQKKKREIENEKILDSKSTSDMSLDTETNYKKKKNSNDISHLL